MNKNRYDRFMEGILPSFKPYNLTDKDRNVTTNVRYMLARTQSMFKWENLPDTIPERFLELYLQVNSNVCITKVNGELYAFTGGLGGEPDPYYQPTIYTVANPALNFNANLKIHEECVVGFNDSMHEGLAALIEKYATLLMENEISMNMCSINSRITNIIDAPDDASYKAAMKFTQDILEGKLSAIGSDGFDERITVNPASVGNNQLTNLIEYHQYIRASLWNELGLNANYNMKRESINGNEADLNSDALRPLIDDMLEQRQMFADEVNKLYGTNITVDLNSSWKSNQIEEEITLENLENEDDPEEPPVDNEGEVDKEGEDDDKNDEE